MTAHEKQPEPAQPRTLPFLLEVGCEEIPARFLRDAERDLGERLLAGLREDRLLPEAGEACQPPIWTYSTPRRLVVHVAKLSAQQPDKVEELQGPPLKVAVDAEGKYTRAAESFAQKNSARLEDLIRTTTAKGEYLSLRKIAHGRSAQEVLEKRLQVLLWNLGFPKSMYWEQTEGAKFRFVRPIRWLLALLGEGENARVVPFGIPGNVSAGNTTFGHRIKGAKPLPVSSFKYYMKKLRQSFVEVDPAKRSERVIGETQEVAKKAGLKLVQDDLLVDWVVNSTEWPRAMLGNFDPRFLHLPREILITVMRDHQKYFAVEDEQGKLQPHFVAVLNVDSDEKGLIREGHERVLAARFRDAEFFWNADQRVPLRDRMPLLEKVTYQAELGSYADKVKRMLVLGESVRTALERHDPQSVVYSQALADAIRLCKCDLTTQMVQEFPELQGVVGGLYATAQGEPREVAEAIYDHYLPQGLEDRCPRSVIGAVVSLADKVDAVAAGFALGRRPTGSSDPYAVRRQANGFIKVLLEIKLPISLDSLIALALDSLHESLTFDLNEVSLAIGDFLRERLTYYLENVSGLRHDTVRAAMQARYLVLEPLQVLGRAKAIERIRPSDDFVSLAQSAKRIRNILRKSARPEDYEGGTLDPQRLEAGPERALYMAYERVREHAAQKRAEGDIYGALESIATLRSPVDAFFDEVLVMAEDPEVRRNRLQLLVTLDRLFTEDADLSEIGKPNVDASTSTTRTSQD